MTLILGIKCSDGVVVAADGAATLGSLGDRTVIQPMKKLCIVGDRVILGFSGAVGLAQQFRAKIEEMWEGKVFSGVTSPTSEAVRQRIRDALWPLAEKELRAAAVAREVIGHAAVTEAICFTLVAMPIGREACLFRFTQQMASEEATRDLPYFSEGSGQRIADPFLAFIRRVFWPDRLPTVTEGVFAAFWTLEHAIAINPGGVAPPKQIVVLESASKGFGARELSEDDLREAEQAVHELETHIRDFFQVARKTTPEPPPAE